MVGLRERHSYVRGYTCVREFFGERRRDMHKIWEMGWSWTWFVWCCMHCTAVVCDRFRGSNGLTLRTCIEDTLGITDEALRKFNRYWVKGVFYGTQWLLRVATSYLMSNRQLPA
jgi:hypothetical protein